MSCSVTKIIQWFAYKCRCTFICFFIFLFIWMYIILLWSQWSVVWKKPVWMNEWINETGWRVPDDRYFVCKSCDQDPGWLRSKVKGHSVNRHPMGSRFLFHFYRAQHRMSPFFAISDMKSCDLDQCDFN